MRQRAGFRLNALFDLERCLFAQFLLSYNIQRVHCDFNKSDLSSISVTDISLVSTFL